MLTGRDVLYDPPCRYPGMDISAESKAVALQTNRSVDRMMMVHVSVKKPFCKKEIIYHYAVPLAEWVQNIDHNPDDYPFRLCEVTTIEVSR